MSAQHLQIIYILTTLAVPGIVIGWLCCLCYCVVKHLVHQEQQLKVRQTGSVIVIVEESVEKPSQLFTPTNKSLQILKAGGQMSSLSPVPMLPSATGFTSIPATRPPTRPGTRPGTTTLSTLQSGVPDLPGNTSQISPSAPTLEPLPQSPRSRPMLPTPPKAKTLWTPLPPIQGAAQKTESNKKDESYIPFFSLLPNQSSLAGMFKRPNT